MCQPKKNGGERCAAHTRQEVSKAAAKAKTSPSTKNNIELKKAMEAYNRTATGTQELRKRGDYASVTLADRYDAERKARRVGRKDAKSIAGNSADNEEAIYGALYSAERDGVQRHDENFYGFVLQDVRVGTETGEDGRTPVTFNYDYVTDSEIDSGTLDGGTVMMRDLHDAEGAERTFEIQAKNANEALDWEEAAEQGEQAEKREEALRERFGDNYEHAVDPMVEVNPPYDAGLVGKFHEDWIDERDVEQLDDHDLELLSTHALATDDKKQEAREEMEARNDPYAETGYDADGYDADGLDRTGFDADGYDEEGTERTGSISIDGTLIMSMTQSEL